VEVKSYPCGSAPVRKPLLELLTDPCGLRRYEASPVQQWAGAMRPGSGVLGGVAVSLDRVRASAPWAKHLVSFPLVVRDRTATANAVSPAGLSGCVPASPRNKGRLHHRWAPTSSPGNRS